MTDAVAPPVYNMNALSVTTPDLEVQALRHEQRCFIDLAEMSGPHVVWMDATFQKLATDIAGCGTGPFLTAADEARQLRADLHAVSLRVADEHASVPGRYGHDLWRLHREMTLGLEVVPSIDTSTEPQPEEVEP